MELRFSDKDLEEYAKDYKLSVRKLGARRAFLFHQRLTEIVHLSSIEDMKLLPGHYHALTSDRKGQWACNLDHPYRLIFVIEEVNDSGSTSKTHLIKAVEIEEIVDYH